MKKVLILFTFLFSLFSLSAETFRVNKLHKVTVSNSLDFEKTITCGINDSVVFEIPKNLHFVEGLEVKVKIPSSVMNWQDCVAYSFYDSIKPSPTEAVIDYEGKRIFVMPLPSKSNYIFQVPFKEKNSIKDSSYIFKLPVVPALQNGVLFLRFMPVMKGIPEETLNGLLELSIRPVFSDFGAVKLNVEYFDTAPENYSLYINDIPQDVKKDYFELVPGVYKVQVSSSNYRDEIQTIVVERSKVSNVNLVLKSLVPFVKITAPQVAQVYFDDQKILDLSKSFEVSEGEHLVKMVIGDYELIRSININKGKSYTINLNVEMTVTED